MFTATKDKALLTTTTGALPRPGWYTENLRGLPLSQGFSQRAYREQHFDCLACHVAAQHRAGIDIMVDGDTRLDDDVAGRSWVSYATERIAGIGKPRVEVPPAGFMADKGPGDLMWEVIETRMTPPVEGAIGETSLQLDRAYKAVAAMTDRPVKIGSISAQILALMLADEHYDDRFRLLMDLSAALNREYHALADAGAPIVQIEEPAIHQVIADPSAPIRPERWVEAFNAEVAGLRDRCEVWCHTCWGSPAAQRVASRDQSYKAALPYLDQLDVDVLTFEGAFNNGMDFEHFGSMISKDKKIAIGVISHRTLQVERPEEIAGLIRRALKHIEPERLILSSDCGFGRQAMSRMHAFYKMVALVRGANIVRRELGLPQTDVPATDPKLSMVPLASL
jgi:5-methyltetrahydropteroyltriglutamate--homocysteine methyltransferase